MARPRKPTRLKVIQGTAQNCRLNPDEPQFPAGIPAPPSHLSQAAREFWLELSELMASRGIIGIADGRSMECMAETYAELRAARAALAKYGAHTYETSNGSGSTMYRAYPEVGIVSDCDRRLALWFSRFGLTPADRSRVSSAGKAKVDAWDDFVKQA